MKTATLRLKYLQAALITVSTEETRYYLNGVCVEITPRAITYVSTDGHRLFAALDALPPAKKGKASFRLVNGVMKQIEAPAESDPDHTLLGSFIIPSAVIKGLKFSKRETPEFLTLSNLSDDQKSRKLNLATPYGTGAIFEPIDGTFPDWRRVIPQTTTGTPIGKKYGEKSKDNTLDTFSFNFDYLANFKKIGDIVGGLAQISYNGGRPTLISFGNMEECFGVIMPMGGAALHGPQSPPNWAISRPSYAIAAE